MEKKRIFTIISAIIIVAIVVAAIAAFVFVKPFKPYKGAPRAGAVNIVFILNEYASGLDIIVSKVALRSLVKNKKDDSKYDIYIVGSRLSNKTIKDLNSLKKENVDVIIINYVRFQGILNEAMRQIPDFSWNAYLTSHLCDTFPDFNKIIHLAPTVLVQGDLSELYNMDISGSYYTVQKIFPSAFYSRRNDITLLNLDNLKKNRKGYKLMRGFGQVWAPAEKIKVIPWTYNFPVCNLQKVPVEFLSIYYDVPAQTYNSFEDFVKRVNVFTFRINDDLWNDKVKSETKDLWYSYLTVEEKKQFMQMRPRNLEEGPTRIEDQNNFPDFLDFAIKNYKKR